MKAPGDAGYAAGQALTEHRLAAEDCLRHAQHAPPMPFPWSIGILAAAIGALTSAGFYELRRWIRGRK